MFLCVFGRSVALKPGRVTVLNDWPNIHVTDAYASRVGLERCVYIKVRQVQMNGILKPVLELLFLFCVNAAESDVHKGIGFGSGFAIFLYTFLFYFFGLII